MIKSEPRNPSPEPRSPAAALRVANAPCSWGALEFNWAGSRPPFAQVLDEMASTGYIGTELGQWGFMPTEPDALRGELGERGLSLVGAFVPVRLTVEDDHQSGVDEAVRVGGLLAASAGSTPFVVLSDATARDPERTRIAGRVRPEDGLDDKSWDTVARGANRIANAVKEATGLRTVFHHHCATFVETGEEIDTLMRLTSAAVGLCLDTGHAAFGGGDPVAILNRHRDRVRHVHFKDCSPSVAAAARRERLDYVSAVRRGIFCELGRGSVDFEAILDELRRRSYDGWIVVEQDVLPSLGTPAESAARNRAFLRTLGV